MKHVARDTLGIAAILIVVLLTLAWLLGCTMHVHLSGTYYVSPEWKPSEEVLEAPPATSQPADTEVLPR